MIIRFFTVFAFTIALISPAVAGENFQANYVPVYKAVYVPKNLKIDKCTSDQLNNQKKNIEDIGSYLNYDSCLENSCMLSSESNLQKYEEYFYFERANNNCILTTVNANDLTVTTDDVGFVSFTSAFLETLGITSAEFEASNMKLGASQKLNVLGMERTVYKTKKGVVRKKIC